ncbi:MAG: DUF3313 family protein [Gammaproteobacteria bacterium]|nr:DUF3313 family protein [Gammaproteobacteria bacterium]
MSGAMSRSRYLLLSVVIVAITSCTQTTVETFRKPAESRADDAYFKSGVDFGRFSKLKPVALEIYFYEGQGQPGPETVARIRRIFREAFLAEIGDDYPIVDAAGPDVLGVRASLVDLKHTQALGSLPVKGRAARLVANGQLTFFMELTDTETGEVLARAADQEKAPAEPLGMSEDRVWVETEVQAKRWAGMFRDFLDENLNRS